MGFTGSYKYIANCNSLNGSALVSQQSQPTWYGVNADRNIHIGTNALKYAYAIDGRIHLVVDDRTLHNKLLPMTDRPAMQM